MNDERKLAIAEGFKNLPNVKDAAIYNPGESEDVGHIDMAAARIDFDGGSTYLMVSEDVWAESEPHDVAEFYRDVVARYAKSRNLIKS